MSWSYIDEWLSLLLRWGHVVIAVTWIGTSVYFMRLDGSLQPPRSTEDARDGVYGETWGVHGGGVYHNQKYRVAPDKAPSHLHPATPWPAWGTWISGFFLLVFFYWFNAGTYLVDRSVAAISPTEAILLSIAMLVVGWLVYDASCRYLREDRLVACVLVVLVVVSAYVSAHLFAARAAWVMTGAVLGTMMSANVAFVIQGANIRLAGDHERTEEDARIGARAKQRSTHNSYLTLPVLLAMLGNHFTFLAGGEKTWVTLAALMLIGAVVRHFFVAWNAGERLWAIPVAAAVAVVIVVIMARPSDQPSAAASSTPATPATVAAGRALFLSSGCSGCHTLKDASATGKVGPNLDQAKPDASLVIQRLEKGAGAMPSFTGRLTPEQMQDLAEYVTSVAGK